MDIQKGHEVEVRIEALAFGGKGLAHVDGMAVFVDGAAPGDLATVRITRRKPRYAEGRIVALLEPSADRVPPRCIYSGICGGCKWQFVAYPTQLDYKRRHVVESLAHIGGLADVPVHPTIASPLCYGYRNKMEFSCTDRPWQVAPPAADDNTAGFGVGLHVAGTFARVLDIDCCHLQPELGNRILATTRELIVQSGVPPYGLKSHQGFWRFVVLRHSAAADRWLVNLITAAERPELVRPLAERLMADYPAIVAVVNNITARRAAIAVGEREIALSPCRVLHDRIGELVFEVSANSFFQTNTAGAARLYDVVKGFARLDGSQTVVDLYCGTGTIALCLASEARQVVGIELNAGAVADARRNAAANGIGNCTFVAGDVRDVIDAVEHRPDVLVIDPPRAGLHPNVVRQVADAGAGRIVYVSCNPATLARDLALFEQHYQVCEIQPVDMFPHTAHIEAVARLERI